MEDLIQYGGTTNETSVRQAFQQLLSDWAESNGGLMLVPELAYKPAGKKTTVVPDGTIRDFLQQSRGYWEAKDENDSLADEIQKKFAKGYPKDNIIFEDSQTAILIQNGEEVQRVLVSNANDLLSLLKHFFAFEPPEVTAFRKAIENFRSTLPNLLIVLRKAIDDAENNATYRQERDHFVDLGQNAMNPAFNANDAGEMLIQHILTGEIFRSVFDNPQYFEENNIAQQLEKVTQTFYKGQLRRNIDELTKPYYGAIKAAASKIADHHEKQKFLKVLYENFYRAYNPAAADKLGIFYTPNEIVRFMIETTDALLERHFNKGLADKGVEILDPATGTGTFITELIEYFPKSKLTYKYEHELHCNELALLPYYIANLNIEATYAQKMGKYSEFKNIVLVDTLDNTEFGIKGEYNSLFESISVENLDRVKRQNELPIKVIIGNPPYRANQANENDNNKNRKYPKIDKRIKDTYIKYSTAQKTKLYDMYARFLRWATDRIKEEGIIAFVMNRSFLDSRTFDGFRKVAAEEYTHLYVVDLGGDVRANPKLSGTKHNVFAIQTGIAIAFLIKQKPEKDEKNQLAEIKYIRRPELEIAREKLEWIKTVKFNDLAFEKIRPDNKHNWLNQTDKGSDWVDFMPIADKETKAAKGQGAEKSIFKLYSLGVVTNRDEWVYDFNYENVKNKVKYLIKYYNNQVSDYLKSENSESALNSDIKWTRAVKKDLLSGKRYKFDNECIRRVLYRPFTHSYLYYSSNLNEMQYQMPLIFPQKETKNKIISFDTTDKDFSTLSSNCLIDLHFNGDSQCLPLYIYKNGERINNVTDFALKGFQAHYQDKTISREDIFNYVYAVLHHPAYRQKYALNLRQEFPRIPFYPEFKQWVTWGTALMNLHIDFETATPYELTQLDIKPKNETPEALAIAQKAKLKADKKTGSMILDGLTTLHGVPPEAWEYKLGNRSALEWVLERHKETTPKDPTIREKFNTYRFANHKEQVIDLLKRVTTISVSTIQIIGQMPPETV